MRNACSRCIIQIWCNHLLPGWVPESLLIFTHSCLHRPKNSQNILLYACTTQKTARIYYFMPALPKKQPEYITSCLHHPKKQPEYITTCLHRPKNSQNILLHACTAQKTARIYYFMPAPSQKTARIYYFMPAPPKKTARIYHFMPAPPKKQPEYITTCLHRPKNSRNILLHACTAQKTARIYCQLTISLELMDILGIS